MKRKNKDIKILKYINHQHPLFVEIRTKTQYDVRKKNMVFQETLGSVVLMVILRFVGRRNLWFLKWWEIS